jgi:hypothetical protein
LSNHRYRDDFQAVQESTWNGITPIGDTQGEQR